MLTSVIHKQSDLHNQIKELLKQEKKQIDNSDLIKEVSDFYIKDGDFVADVTWGKGVFWKKVDTTRFWFFPTDLLTMDVSHDFRALPYDNEVFNHVILDPPYMHSPGKTMLSKNYQNTAAHGQKSTIKTRTIYHNEIIEDYEKGMQEAWRVLEPGGMLWVKCKDEIESGWQRWSHIEIYADARKIGFVGKDLFILVPTAKVNSNHARQLHARKTHSYLWLFIKPTDREAKQVEKYKIR